jgi:hypothetical protein
MIVLGSKSTVHLARTGLPVGVAIAIVAFAGWSLRAGLATQKKALADERRSAVEQRPGREAEPIAKRKALEERLREVVEHAAEGQRPAEAAGPRAAPPTPQARAEGPRQSAASQPRVITESLNLSGVWRDNWGNVSQITQRGDAYTFTAWAAPVEAASARPVAGRSGGSTSKARTSRRFRRRGAAQERCLTTGAGRHRRASTRYAVSSRRPRFDNSHRQAPGLVKPGLQTCETDPPDLARRAANGPMALTGICAASWERGEVWRHPIARRQT